MPMYNVKHSFPLTVQQKRDIATHITRLHAETFTTPSMFVNVSFSSADATSDNFFQGGTPKHDTLNAIEGMVRTSDSRTKESFDKLAEAIEHAWLQVMGLRAGENEDQKDVDKRNDKVSSTEKAAMQLSYVAFYPLLAVREKGFVIPKAGDEGSWFKENKKHFEELAEMGDETFKAMLQEVEDRDDLKAWRG